MIQESAVGRKGSIWARANHEFVAMRLAALDGSAQRSSFVVFRLPPGVAFRDYTGDFDPPCYLQVAGSSEALSIEVRHEVLPNGFEHLVLGRPGVDNQAAIEIPVGSFSTKVHQHEVFTADTALPIVFGYIETGTIPEELTSRPYGTGL